ncbi:ankyrin repeat domain-containing protein 34B [Numida meleagris]|uniref:ankyrin repeat domain-containing protein 34B n=1 Tax=Numida meleagris TaxID=8996 RepID=UPI000B3DD95A|nr:ankyrin repeat domain-containing protein 34B [Numida meleagris]XP_021237037.1 ankyrin repeat domain-containing protein 34B [Numida meleagris]
MNQTTELPTEGNSLIRAVYQSRLRLTRLLLEGGVCINESNNRGETPLMIACRTKHVDSQSVSKAKMVKYLLENKADPNIQDKSGKTALMHACLEKAGPEVVSLLLKSGADPSLQDHSHCSALVYAINSEDKETLEVLLNACRARGKEVIIITTDKSPSGRQTAKQYLNVSPADLEECQSPAACTSPSEIELKLSAPLSGSNGTKRAFFNFKDLDHPRSTDHSRPVSPRNSSSSDMGSRMAHVQQLQSEPWVKSSPSLFHQSKVSSLYGELQDVTPEEELSSKANGFALSKRFVTRHQSTDIKDTANLLKTTDQNGSRKLPYDDINSQTRYGEEEHLPSGIPGREDEDSSLGQINFISNLSSIIKKGNLEASHYSSDSQLTTTVHAAAAEDSKSVIGKKKIVSTSHSLFPSSRDLLEKISAVPMSRRKETFLGRWGSGALLLDNIAQTRPGFLPPLNVNPQPPIPAINLFNKVSGMISHGQKYLVPEAPASLSETKNTKMLLRRQSLQTEQIRQLLNF